MLMSMIELQEYQEAWADEFRAESARLMQVLSGQIEAIEHIGSTAVPGLIAKPIIDIATHVAATVDPRTLDVPLARLGYEPNPAGPRNHAVYTRSASTRRTHILHAFTHNEWTACNQRLFRDKLLGDASARSRYGDLKRNLSKVADGRTYTSLKTELIQELLNEERASRGLPPAPAWEK